MNSLIKLCLARENRKSTALNIVMFWCMVTKYYLTVTLHSTVSWPPSVSPCKIEKSTTTLLPLLISTESPPKVASTTCKFTCQRAFRSAINDGDWYIERAVERASAGKRKTLFRFPHNHRIRNWWTNGNQSFRFLFCKASVVDKGWTKIQKRKCAEN